MQALVDTLQHATSLAVRITNLPPGPGWWSRTWPVLLGALIGGGATIAAQAMRAFIDANREREEVRQMLLLLVTFLEGWLQRLAIGASTFNLPRDAHFWAEADALFAANDRLGRSVFLLPGHVGAYTWVWFQRVSRVSGGGQTVIRDHLNLIENGRDDPDAHKYFDSLQETASGLETDGAELRELLNAAAPKGWHKWGASKEQLKIGDTTHPTVVPTDAPAAR